MTATAMKQSKASDTNRGHRFFSAIFLLTIFSLTALGKTPPAANSQAWVASWRAAQQVPEPQNALPAEDAREFTMRQIFRLSTGGATLRVHVSNAFGTEPLQFSSIHIARPIAPSTSAIDAMSDKALTFSGRTSVVVPAGAEYISDPVDFPVAALSSVAVTFHIDDATPSRQTGHPGSRATSYYVHGDFVSAPTLPNAKQIDHWYQISGIDVLAASNAAAIVVLGDSITDGRGSTTNGNDRWTDVLAERLQSSQATRNVGVLNEGIGGNHLLTDGLGPNALARFDRDVLAHAGARWLIVLEGINDLGGLARAGEVNAAEHALLAHRIVGAYEQMIARAHARGMKVIGATIMPYVGSEYYHPGPANEADRQAVNEWMRKPGHFDAVIDFDRIIRDPKQPDRLLPAYDSGDHLHPSAAGYRAMGEAVPLSLFTR